MLYVDKPKSLYFKDYYDTDNFCFNILVAKNYLLAAQSFFIIDKTQYMHYNLNMYVQLLQVEIGVSCYKVVRKVSTYLKKGMPIFCYSKKHIIKCINKEIPYCSVI